MEAKSYSCHQAKVGSFVYIISVIADLPIHIGSVRAGENPHHTVIDESKSRMKRKLFTVKSAWAEVKASVAGPLTGFVLTLSFFLAIQ